MFMNTLGKSKFNQKDFTSPDKDFNKENENRGYQSDGFANMKRDFESSLRNPPLDVDITNAQPLSHTADFKRTCNKSKLV